MSDEDNRIERHWKTMFYVGGIGAMIMLSTFALINFTDVFAPMNRRWAVVEGEQFQFSGFHIFNNGNIEKVDVTCTANGMPTEPTQTVNMDCTPLNVYGHTPASDTDSDATFHDIKARRGR